MGQIALLSDRPTSAYFKVTGIKNSYAVKDRDDAEKVFRKVYADETISLIMVTEPVMQWIQPILERTKKEFPLVVSIPAKGGSKAQADVLAQLIKRTVGIELKM
ncbi:MAG: V-type ATP synthase subunit F [Candidatus Bathyarchaeia archaeon]